MFFGMWIIGFIIFITIMRILFSACDKRKGETVSQSHHRNFTSEDPKVGCLKALIVPAILIGVIYYAMTHGSHY